MCPALCFALIVGTVPRHVLIFASKLCWHGCWHVLLVGLVAVAMLRREDGAGLVAMARLVQESMTSLLGTFHWSLVCVFLYEGAVDF